ncbi:MAG: SAP domain-containing protein [Candidatus Thermoplasmatota archaeon]|nr:SAP domain-containing protein [Candidatus Thermoplasmatota archaeon]
MTKPFSKYNDLTIVELKEILKSKNLPISGTKSVLINRLEEHDVVENSKENTTVAEKKVKFKCVECDAKLKIPKSYNGKIKCPVCSYEQEINGGEINDLDISDIFSFFTTGAQISFQKIKSLDSKKVSLTISISAAILMIIAILTFFSAFTYESMCPEENRGTAIIDGEEYPSCEGASWVETETADKLFNSCCILLPLSLTLAIVGYSVRKEGDDRLKVLDPLKNQVEGKFIVNTSNKNNTLIDNTTKVIQFSILGVSITLSVLTIVGTILIIIFFILAIYSLLSSGSFFA